MCYLLGVYSPCAVISFTELLKVARKQLLLRGRDAVGCFYSTLEQQQSSKMVFSGAAIDVELDNFLSSLPPNGHHMMLQTRAVPEPEVNVQGSKFSLLDTQPFDTGGYVVSHNGTVANDRELRARLSHVPWSSKSSVDSLVLPYMFEKEGILRTIRDLTEGSFAIAAFDRTKKRFHLAKNFQPLYYGLPGNKLYYSSLPTHLTPIEFPPYSLLSMDARCIPEWRSLYREEPKKSILVTHSGGLDSTITLRLYQVLGYDVRAVFFKYGQQAEEAEEHCSRFICSELNIPLTVMTLPMGCFKSPLLTKEKPELDVLEDAESTFSYVPQRNLILAAYSLGIAEQLGLGGVALGMNLSDGGSYPDNGIPFLNKLGEVTPYSSNWQTQLKVTAPFVNLMKSEMLEVGILIGIPFDRICSCYYPVLSSEGYPIYCGSCGSDLHYKNAWGKLGYRPPNIGFESEPLTKFIYLPTDPTARFELKDLPYGHIIKETL